MERPLKKGIAYHSNRILKHVREDLHDIIEHHFNLVVHTFSHNDFDRHRSVMRDIVAMTEELGLDVWIDNWGLAGPPGDKSHFLSYHPDSHQIFSNGEREPTRVCLASPAFRQFTKEWIDVVKDIGGRTIFWDEPHLAGKQLTDGKPAVWACRCERCRSLFAETYGRSMPAELSEEVERFRVQTVVDYFAEVTQYSKERGLDNAVCVMLGDEFGLNLNTAEAIAKLPHLDNIGSDPYWLGLDVEPYAYNYEAAARTVRISQTYGKDHNVWIQGYGFPRGREEEIVDAADAAYDAGARTILVWGFRGGESNDYRAERPDITWKTIGDAMRRITERDRDRRRERLQASVVLAAQEEGGSVK